MKTISEVVLYLTDLTPGQFLEGSIVMLPQELAPRADQFCQLNGMLLEYLARNPELDNQWMRLMSDQEWRGFWAKEFAGQEVQVYQAKGGHIQYTLGIIMTDCR